jgi:hypothetical protein
MNPHIIVDLDNCIADDGWRIPRIDWSKTSPLERYHDYHSLSAFDLLVNEDIMMAGQEVIVFTARPVLYRAITEEWLSRKCISHKHLIMRNNGDHRSSVELKREMLHWLPENYGVMWKDIVGAFDDRQDVVDMYRRYGIDAHVRAAHGECAYTAPKKEAA